MHETPASFSHIESPAPGSALPAGQHSLRGWVWPEAGGIFVDVRAKIGLRVFPGVHGLPRTDLAAHFKTGRPWALAEFQVVVDLAPGEAVIELEALAIEGRWAPFATVRYPVASAAQPATVATPSGPLRWHEYGRVLQLLLRTCRAQPDRPLDDLITDLLAEIPYPRDLRHPHLPFHGHLDEPAALTRCGFGRTAVLGYLFHETQPIRRVLGTFDLQAWQTIEHRRLSPGPAAHFSQFDQAKDCGLFGIIDVPAQLPNPVCLRLYAELADGSLHLCSVQRSRLFTQEDEKAPSPPGKFDPVHKRLLKRMQSAGIELVEDDDFNREVGRIRADFDRRAPQSLPAVPPLQLAPATASGSLPRRILLVTHNLNLEGAPLFAVDYAAHLATQGAQLTVLSPSDGPLHARFAAGGAGLRLLSVDQLFSAQSDAEARTALAALGRDFDFGAFDLVVANTFTTFWAVHAAKAAGRPALFYVHESTTPASFYSGRVHSSVVALAEAAFGLADCVSFTTAATRRYHIDYGRPENHHLTPGWIDVARIDAWRAYHPREQLRAGFNLRPGEQLVTNVGTVCDRKGQHIFARGVDLLWRRHPALAARCRFVMLGGGDKPFDAVLADLLTQLDRPNLVVHPASADYLAYYAAADLFVCSTYEESSPRVILEAMACETPLLSSAVHGIPEQVRSGIEATLIPPGDTIALCEGMAHLLQMPALGRALAHRARARVVAEFDVRILLPRHAALAAETFDQRAQNSLHT